MLPFLPFFLPPRNNGGVDAANGWLRRQLHHTNKTGIQNQTQTEKTGGGGGEIENRPEKDFENHRTSTEYEDSLVAKLFCFTFCNSYGGFVYLAFIGEPVVGVDCEKSCMSLLATNLTIVFVVQLLVRRLFSVCVNL